MHVAGEITQIKVPAARRMKVIHKKTVLAGLARCVGSRFLDCVACRVTAATVPGRSSAPSPPVSAQFRSLRYAILAANLRSSHALIRHPRGSPAGHAAHDACRRPYCRRKRPCPQVPLPREPHTCAALPVAQNVRGTGQGHFFWQTAPPGAGRLYVCRRAPPRGTRQARTAK